MDILKQLGELLLTSIPTIICFLVLWVAYRQLVHKKLEQILAERHARTEGAMQEAQSEISKAEARTAEYEQRLREARSQIYKAQEGRRRHIMEKRSAALAQARQHADETVKHARAALERDVNEARSSLESQADALADQVIASILRPVAASGSR
ncbi:MAG TPA: ATP synthase F0 subunit B [Candidatus Angelobacter sp.]